MLGELRMGAVLDGVRGQPGVDRARLASLLSRLSHWAAAMQPWLAELDLNPVLAGVNGPEVVDCVMVFKRQGEDPLAPATPADFASTPQETDR